MTSSRLESLRCLLVDYVAFLDAHKWLYDFQVTELFARNVIRVNFPSEWIRYFKALTNEQLNQIVMSSTQARDDSAKQEEEEGAKNSSALCCPGSLAELISEARMLRSRLIVSEFETDISIKSTTGISAKKQHEIARMVPFIKELCSKHECKCVIDIGAGLGYFDRLLVENSDVVVVGVEKQADFAREADKRNRDHCSDRIVNVAHTLDENSGRRLIELVDESLARVPSGGEALESGNYGLTSLHSCGDLTPLMLKIFKADDRKLKFLAAFSCCYHKMAPEEAQKSEEGSKHFQNFPMSESLKSIINRGSHRDFYLGTFGLRLACQQTTSVWSNKSPEDHEEHKKQVAYRAILEDFCQRNGLKLVKKKRKLAGKEKFESFQVYVENLRERVEFQDSAGQLVEPADLQAELSRIQAEHEPLFDAIEPLTVLQALIQPLLEGLVLVDRLVYLLESGIEASLVKLFDDSISPRSHCILAEKS